MDHCIKTEWEQWGWRKTELAFHDAMFRDLVGSFPTSTLASSLSTVLRKAYDYILPR